MDYKTSPDHKNARRVIGSLERLGIKLDFIVNFPTIGVFFTDTTPLQSKAYYGVAMGDDAVDIIISVNNVPGVRDLPPEDLMRFMNDFNQIKSDDFACMGTLLLNNDRPELRYYIDKNDFALQSNIDECVGRIRRYVHKIEMVAKGEESFSSLACVDAMSSLAAQGVSGMANKPSVSEQKKPKKKGLFGKLFT